MIVTLNREKLRAKRREKALTQEKLAEQSGLSDRYIRSLECEAAQPSASVLYRISQALEVPMDDLMTAIGRQCDES